jgi:tetratricopeptide (TPR) repeat protein
VPFALLQTIAEEPEEALRLGLTHLQAAEFLYEGSFFPELAYIFKHALTHEVAYGSLLHERRRALHARLVEAIEMRAGDRLVDHVERLAHHALQGAVWDKAVAYFRQAGARSVAHSANRQAVACFEQALEALRHLPACRDRQEQGIDLRFDLRNALDPLGELRQILDYLGEAESLAEALNDQRRLGRVAGYRGDYFRLLADHAQAIESGHRALAIAAHLGDFALQVQANVFLGQVYLALGNYCLAIDLFKQIVVSLEGEMHRERFGLAALPTVVSRAYLALCLAEIGAFAEGITHAEEAIRIAVASDHPSSVIYAHIGAGGLYLRQGDVHRAIPVLERGLGLCQSASLPFLFPLVASLVGSAYVLSTRLAEGLPLLDQAVEQAASTGRRVGHSLRVADLSEALLLAGRLDDAMHFAGHALDLARTAKERGHEAWTLRLLAEIHAHRDPQAFEPAETFYRQARALADELGTRPLVAHCHLGLGTLHAKIGRREQSRGELSTAMALYQTMQMTFWLTRAEAVLAQMS